MTTSDTLADLGPIAQLRAGRLPRRLVQLLGGLVVFGVSLAFMVRGELGLAPWDVLHYGVALHVPLSFGQVIVMVSFLTLLLWIPLREKPGIGTVANAIVVGVAVDVTLRFLPHPTEGWIRVAFTLTGVVLCGAASALYIGAQLGRGPRDGLMTGLSRRTGLSIRTVRTGIELTVLGLGLILGGSVGLGTLLFAFGIGPLTQLMLPGLTIDVSERPARPVDADHATDRPRHLPDPAMAPCDRPAS